MPNNFGLRQDNTAVACAGEDSEPFFSIAMVKETLDEALGVL